MLRMILAAALLSAAPAAHAHGTTGHDLTTKVTPLVTNPLQGIPGKEGTMLLVEYPPGGSDPVHRHNASAFVYVLEGSIIMGVRGGKEVKLNVGDTFLEQPDDIHTVGRNASTTKPAKFVVFIVKDVDAPAFILDE